MGKHLHNLIISLRGEMWINISSPYVSSMDKRWTYDGGNGYILILKYQSFETESGYDYVTVSVWHYLYH
jgi:hypothetical protein